MDRHVQPDIATGLSNDDTDPDVYEDRFNTIVEHGFIALGIALGHKTGLLKTLVDLKEPESSREIAEKAGLRERYVREWLFSMVAAKIVFITDDNKYYIPEDCKQKTGKSLFATLLPAMAPLTADLVQCFRSKDDGVAGYDFSKLAEIFKFTDEDRKKCDAKWLEDNLIPFQLKKADEIKQILDIGCGTGSITINIAKFFPEAHVIGVDIDDAAIATAKRHIEEENMTNIEFHVMKGEELKTEWTAKFDWVTMLTTLHDLPNPDPCVMEVLRVMTNEGVYTALDPVTHSDPKLNIGNKMAAASLLCSCYVCLPCGFSAPPAVGHGIGWGLENRAEYLRDKGFKVHGNHLMSIIHCTKL